LNQADYSLLFEGVGKCYSLYDNPAARMWDSLLGRKPNAKQFWALQQANVSIKPGEVVGLVGKNGAGKSTFLQLACGTLKPTVGQIRTQGRIAALLELGAGFSPEFTGRQNILLNAPLFGLSHQEVKERIDSIIEFADIGRFVDLPVRTYSSGMFVRLAFSLATSVEPQILIVDEALSVGDGEFARRSFDRIMSLKEKGATVLFCSHSPFQVESLCERALWIDQGRVRMDGLARDVVAAYNDFLDEETERLSAASPQTVTPLRAGESSDPQVVRQALAPVTSFFSPGHATGRLTKVTASVDGVAGRDLIAESGKSNLAIDFEFEVSPEVPAPQLAVTIHQPNGRIIASAGTWVDQFSVVTEPSSKNSMRVGRAVIQFPNLPLLKGQYTLSAFLFCERGLLIYSAGDHFGRMTVTQDHVEQGIVSLPHKWANASMDAPNPSHRGALINGVLIEDFDPRHMTGIQNLFQICFNKPFNSRVWDWKYKWSAGTPGKVALRDGEVIGFLGGLLRPAEAMGQRVYGLQIGDVMVHPRERAAFSRRGVFYQMAQAYLGQHLHVATPKHPPAGKVAVFAYGFPNARAMKLGQYLGFYKPSGAILELNWAASVGQPDPLLAMRRKESIQFSESRLFRKMIRTMPEMTLPDRSDGWIAERYLNHPTHSYIVFVLKNRLLQQVQCAMVVRERKDHLEWIDYVGPAGQLTMAIEALRRQAFHMGKERVAAWINKPMLHYFNHHQPQVAETEIIVPVNQFPESVFSEQLSENLWLMSGDSDFR
jgi:ABC-type polysaccharide/polyol phosphate transport system ATPase subunit